MTDLLPKISIYTSMLKNKTSPRGRLIVLRMPVVILPSGGNYGGALSACTTSAKWRSEAETLPLCHRAVNGPASCSSPSIDLGTIAEPTFGVRDEQLSRLATSLSAEVEVGMYITHVLSPCVLSFHAHSVTAGFTSVGSPHTQVSKVQTWCGYSIAAPYTYMPPIYSH
jgi:hypothetical protein